MGPPPPSRCRSPRVASSRAPATGFRRNERLRSNVWNRIASRIAARRVAPRHAVLAHWRQRMSFTISMPQVCNTYPLDHGALVSRHVSEVGMASYMFAPHGIASRRLKSRRDAETPAQVIPTATRGMALVIQTLLNDIESEYRYIYIYMYILHQL